MNADVIAHPASEVTTDREAETHAFRRRARVPTTCTKGSNNASSMSGGAGARVTHRDPYRVRVATGGDLDLSTG